VGAVQKHGVGQLPPTRAKCSVAQLVCSLTDAKLLSAVLQHLRHEWQLFKARVRIERDQDFLGGSYHDPIADLQVQFSANR
jgi:hypothetical protein